MVFSILKKQPQINLSSASTLWCSSWGPSLFLFKMREIPTSEDCFKSCLFVFITIVSSKSLLLIANIYWTCIMSCWALDSILSFSSLNKPTRWVLLFFSFYRWKTGMPRGYKSAQSYTAHDDTVHVKVPAPDLPHHRCSLRVEGTTKSL